MECKKFGRGSIGAIRVLVLLLVCAGILGCSPRKSEKKSKSSSKWFYHGDPMEFVLNYRANPLSVIDQKLVEELTEFEWSDSLIIVGRSETNKRTYEDLVEEQKPTDFEVQSNWLNPKDLKIVYKNGNGIVLWTIAGDGNRTDLQLEMAPNGRGAFDVTSVVSSSGRFPVKAEHYSINPDRSAFSVLLSYDSAIGGRDLFGLTFVRTRGKINTLERSDSYSYLLGFGTGARWNKEKPLEITYSSSFVPKMKSALNKSVRLWNKALEGLLSISASESGRACPPVGDVNVNCIYAVTGYLDGPEEARATALAHTTYDISKGEIIDSDIVYFNKNWETYGVQISDPRLEDYFHSTFTHEIGHLLGLGHIFDQTYSIMSYEDRPEIDAVELTSYDVSAIRELYRD